MGTQANTPTAGLTLDTRQKTTTTILAIKEDATIMGALTHGYTGQTMFFFLS